ncbi:endonuclease [Salinimicrobium tongyeongense]|uniref:Endonuclease n=1 Tax=Salinimicrobium tongyeongense TaxID=2809707 RepID=A0ABY6NMA4_9FLAO|nr:endonuclease [Salinimicrobium tongyeongense]UZH54025.1 endonuclease [Salinimicrobium tongyeongense]
MKKYIFLPIVCFLFLFACSTDDNNNTVPNQPVDPEVPEEESIYVIPDALVGYYGGVDFTLSAEELYDELAVLTIEKHKNILGYTDRHDYLYDADEDPSNPANVILLYSGESRSKDEYQSSGNPNDVQTFNTEHVYPKSLLEGDAIADLHILRVADIAINESRLNFPYVDGDGQYKLVNGTAFYPGDEWRGDVARMIMYMNLRYNEPFDEVGGLALFLEWNAEDPVSNFEIQRNEVIYGAQGNRNPFIDNPHLATSLWGGDDAENRWDGEVDFSDEEAPSVPEGLTLNEKGFENIKISWNASTDNVAVTKYYIEVNGEYYTTVTSTTVNIIDLAPGTTYSITVAAGDSAGNYSAMSTALEVTTIADAEAPSVPQDLAVTGATSSSISLSWTASSDNAAVQGYDIYIDGEFYKNVESLDYTIAGLDADHTYSFTVAAVDIYDNASAQSTAVEGKTDADTGDSEGASSIIISEYIEGSFGHNKALEIANFSEETVDLESYSLMKITNASETWDNEFSLAGYTLEAGEVLVIVNSEADRQALLNAADIKTEHQVVNFNGNDPIGLFLDGVLVDMLGEKGGADFAKDVNLRRKPGSTPNTTFVPDEWETFSDENTEGLGTF